MPEMIQHEGHKAEPNFTLVDAVPPLGTKKCTLTSPIEYEPVKVNTDINNNILMENRFIQATFDKSGHLIRLLDKALK